MLREQEQRPSAADAARPRHRLARVRAGLESERRRAGLGLGVLLGTMLAFPGAVWALPALGVPAGFLALGLVVGAPVFPLLHRSLGTGRAALLAAITAVTATVVIAVLAFGACVATGCVG